MKFGIMVDMGRFDDSVSPEQLLRNTTELVQLAEQGGFDFAFCGEHHGHEMTIAPNPLNILTYWATQTESIRLGPAVVCAPYWHPLRLAGEAGLVDLISNGRLVLGIGRGAYPYEFARMANGIPPEVAREALAETLPALRGLWQGDYAHDGKMWSFPSSTSTPRPVQPEGPPIWVSARHPDVFRMACENRCHVMVAPLDRPHEEVVSLRERLDSAVAEVANGWQPEMMVLRQSCVNNHTDRLLPAEYSARRARLFKSLFSTEGHVEQGFVQADPQFRDMEIDLEALTNNCLFGTTDEVVDKLHQYESAGTDVFLYQAGWGLPHEMDKQSLMDFIHDVMPKFRK